MLDLDSLFYEHQKALMAQVELSVLSGCVKCRIPLVEFLQNCPRILNDATLVYKPMELMPKPMCKECLDKSQPKYSTVPTYIMAVKLSLVDWACMNKTLIEKDGFDYQEGEMVHCFGLDTFKGLNCMYIGLPLENPPNSNINSYDGKYLGEIRYKIFSRFEKLSKYVNLPNVPSKHSRAFPYTLNVYAL
jgi:hypothetical protein